MDAVLYRELMFSVLHYTLFEVCNSPFLCNEHVIIMEVNLVCFGFIAHS